MLGPVSLATSSQNMNVGLETPPKTEVRYILSVKSNKGTSLQGEDSKNTTESDSVSHTLSLDENYVQKL